MATCKKCGEEIHPQHWRQEFHNDACRYQWHYQQKRRDKALSELDEIRGYRPSEPQHEAASQLVAKMVRRA